MNLKNKISKEFFILLFVVTAFACLYVFTTLMIIHPNDSDLNEAEANKTLDYGQVFKPGMISQILYKKSGAFRGWQDPFLYKGIIVELNPEAVKEFSNTGILVNNPFINIADNNFGNIQANCFSDRKIEELNNKLVIDSYKTFSRYNNENIGNRFILIFTKKGNNRIIIDKKNNLGFYCNMKYGKGSKWNNE